jgi:hypothetical protein
MVRNLMRELAGKWSETSWENCPENDQKPTNLIETHQKLNIKPEFIKKGKIRTNPYPPNFNKIPAKIIDPATGASTWWENDQKPDPH